MLTLDDFERVFPERPKACKTCRQVFPMTKDFFGHTKSGGFRGDCRDCMKAKNKAWAQANPDKVRARSARYQASKSRWQPTQGIKDMLLAEQRGLCLCCGEHLEGHDVDVDHLIPVSRGGHNGMSNLVLLHRSCNKEKHAKTFPEYLAWRQRCGLPMPEFCHEKLLRHIEDLAAR